MRANSPAICMVFLLTIAATPAIADTILSPGSTWEYTFVDPTANPAWNMTTGGWTTGPAPFGNYTSGSYDPSGVFSYNTLWSADTTNSLDDDLWVRTTFDLTGYALSSIRWDLGVDNGFTLFINGNLVATANGEGYTYRWEYTGDFGGHLAQGTNYLAVALEDHGGLTAFDMQVTGTPVPEPTSLILLGAGLGVIGLASWRRK